MNNSDFGGSRSSMTMLKQNRFVINEMKHQPNSSIANHDHKRASIVCTLRGSFIERVDNRKYECASQSILLEPAGKRHSNRYSRDGAHCLVIEVSSKRLEDSFPSDDVFNRPNYFQELDYFTIVERIRRELEISDCASETAIEGLSLQLLAKLSRQTKMTKESGTPGWLKESVEFIHAHFNETISLSLVATVVDIHPSHLSRVFHKRYHCSIGAYIRRLRLERAATQLIITQKSLADISMDAGFYDQSHFSSAFKLYKGITPSKYRLENK